MSKLSRQDSYLFGGLILWVLNLSLKNNPSVSYAECSVESIVFIYLIKMNLLRIDIMFNKSIPPSICHLCNRPITNNDIESGNFNESQGIVIHQSCYENIEDEFPDIDE